MASENTAAAVFPIDRTPTPGTVPSGSGLAGIPSWAGNPAGSPTTPTRNPPPNFGSGDSVTLAWDAPTRNLDGTPLSDLNGYRVHYGHSSGNYTQSVQVTNPGLTTYVVQNLPAGTYFFAVTAYNSVGTESPLSPEVSTMVD